MDVLVREYNQTNNIYFGNNCEVNMNCTFLDRMNKNFTRNIVIFRQNCKMKNINYSQKIIISEIIIDKIY